MRSPGNDNRCNSQVLRFFGFFSLVNHSVSNRQPVAKAISFDDKLKENRIYQLRETTVRRSYGRRARPDFTSTFFLAEYTFSLVAHVTRSRALIKSKTRARGREMETAIGECVHGCAGASASGQAIGADERGNVGETREAKDRSRERERRE